ncbi:MAG TPA: SDR family oxidoreductase [Dehalococcoidia bacterium]|nr:SDR family oxidoreductase [Dehalococcoidia bacterium]
MDISLEGKVALVTGTGPNIGSGLALMLAKYGAQVACNDVRAEAAEACVNRIERNGGTAMSIPGDVTNEVEVQAYIQRVLDDWGKIDILVNSAAMMSGGGLLERDLKDFNRQVEVGTAGNFLNTKYVAKSMIDRGIKGSIICIISTAGWQGPAGNIGYATSKGGLVQFTRAAAMDLAPFGIRVNSFTPTFTQVDNPELIAERQRQAAARPGARGGAFVGIDPARIIPMGEQPTPTDYGHVVAFMASDYSRLITGTDFRVDGGALAKYWPYIPSEDKAGPLPLIKMDVTGVD